MKKTAQRRHDRKSVPLSARVSFGRKLGLPEEQAAVLAHLRTPELIQDYIDGLRMNFEKGGDTCSSVAETMRLRHAHCIEASFVAACAFWMNGQPPLLMDLRASHDDYDHVVALFRHNGYWGAISKSNHIWLRWRDPAYRTLRELALSYLHEYVNGAQKTLRGYSRQFSLSRRDPALWVSNRKPCWDIEAALDGVRHYPLITPDQARNLRPRDRFEIRAGEILEYRK